MTGWEKLPGLSVGVRKGERICSPFSWLLEKARDSADAALWFDPVVLRTAPRP